MSRLFALTEALGAQRTGVKTDLGLGGAYALDKTYQLRPVNSLVA
jgi:hypothetical protein